jgi:hypothetical protein
MVEEKFDSLFTPFNIGSGLNVLKNNNYIEIYFLALK